MLLQALNTEIKVRKLRSTLKKEAGKWEHLGEQFREADKDGNGFLDVEEIKQMFVGLQMPEAVDCLLQLASRNEGKVRPAGHYYQSFKRITCSSALVHSLKF